MARRPFLAALALWLALAGVAVPQPETLRVGVGKADLTWRVGAGLAGAVTQQLPDVAGQDVPDDIFRFAGLHSRPQAKAIVVEAPDGPFAFVRADILLATGDLTEAVAQRVRDATGIPPERLLLAATHTHVSNNGLFPHFVHGALYRSPDPREQVFIADRIAEAVTEAFETMKPATLAVGSGSVALPSINRRWTAAERDNTPPFANDPSRLDAELGVLRFDDAETGSPIAVLMNYGLHPVVLINNPLVSTDFVGYAERGVERALAGEPMAIWFTGAQGDQDPIYVRYSYPEAEWTGRLFAEETIRVARTLTPESITHAGIADKVIPLPGPDGPALPSSEIAGPRLPLAGPAPLLIPSFVRLQAIELTTASSRTALLTWPGEPIRDIGVALKTSAGALGYDKTYVLALANDWAGYWLTPEEFDRGRYERTLMFYGRDSAAYVEGHLLDLAGSLLTGAEPSQVPLPPNAVFDQALTQAIASAAYAAQPTIEAAVLAIPESVASAHEQPADVERPGVVSFTWNGGSPDVAEGWIPDVEVQTLDGETVAEEGTGDVHLIYTSPQVGQNRWTARWEALPDTPAGEYRFHVEGRLAGAGPFTLASEPFEVKPCTCIAPEPLAVTPSAGGPVTVSVGATYEPVLPLPVPHVQDGFRLQPGRVTTGSALVEVLDGATVIGTMTLAFVSDVQPVARTVTVFDVSGEDLPITIVEPTELGSFQGIWSGAAGVTFRLAQITDAAGNSS